MKHEGDNWAKRAVIYGLDVTTFSDSNGDGIGDFIGLTQRLPYLVDLGISCIWLLPFYKSPRKDNGYDVVAHDEIDPRYGSMRQFEDFLAACHKENVRVLIDLVVNHTSSDHPWFKEAETNRSSRYRDYYIWTDDPSRMPRRTPAFPGEVSTVWTYNERAGQFYFHNFYPFQPELNIANPSVREEIAHIMRFWLRKGVDGFRLDSAGLLLQQKGPIHLEDRNRVLRQLHDTVHSMDPSGLILGEVDLPIDEYPQFYNEGQGIDFFLNFPFAQHLFLAFARQSCEPLIRVFESLSHNIDQSRWVRFLRNLDELNIGRLNASEQREVLSAFAEEEDMQIYGRGIRRRLAPMFNGDHDRLSLAWSLLFSLPGIPMFVYGDEIGMGDCLSLPGRTAVRTPMQWREEPNAGFSSAPSHRLAAPVIATGPFDYRKINVDNAIANRDSLWHRMRHMMAIRRSYPALGGNQHVYEMVRNNVLAVRAREGRQVTLSLFNFASHRTSVEVSVKDVHELQDLFDSGCRLSPRDGKIAIALPPYGYRWFDCREAF